MFFAVRTALGDRICLTYHGRADQTLRRAAVMRGDNQANRFGSSRHATYDDIARAGLFEQRPESFFVGFFEDKPVYFHGPAGLSLVAGARAGKMRDVICRNLLNGTCLQSLIMLDPKAEGAYLSQDQTADGKFCAYWNPVGLHGLPQNRINPLDYLQIDSPTLVADQKCYGVNSPHHAEGPKRTFPHRVPASMARLCLLWSRKSWRWSPGPRFMRS